MQRLNATLGKGQACTGPDTLHCSAAIRGRQCPHRPPPPHYPTPPAHLVHPAIADQVCRWLPLQALPVVQSQQYNLATQESGDVAEQLKRHVSTHLQGIAVRCISGSSSRGGNRPLSH